MFYGSSAHKNSTRNRRGTEPLGEDFWTRRSGRAPPPLPIQQSNATYHDLSQPRQQHLINPNPPTTSEPSEAWAGPASYTHPNFSWLHPQQAGTRRANDPSHDSHAQSRDFPPPVTNSLTNQGDSPATTYQAGLAESPYINATSSVSSDLFPAVSWPYNQGITQGIDQYQPPAHTLGYTPWQSVYNPVENLTASSQRTRTDPSLQSYGPPRPVATPRAAARSLGHLGFGLELQMHGVNNYPSPHSDVSGPTSSSCLSMLPHAMTSPSMPLVASPSVAGSSDFRRSSRRSQEPPRNVQGIMYCDHRECADNPPVFPRKCEWSKHMDKHNRPYVCEEPGCEKINGFTYSGGLSRHQREVHRQHGGPKASCHCPHKDCKRSTGVGFSRKENLLEHLRRVHRDAGTEQTEELEIPLNEAPSAIGSRKRRRPIADDADEGNEVGTLQQEVKKLRKELQEKDERLKRLEQVVAQLAKEQHKEIVR
ncbi:hypothetical protein N7G274_009133 [Stereocaulon virgatum]|uniref:C2H2-type domain-containing protein n=1 Tax=Stereocaulon virgatum TaxID=373712 RepID=A0ABR3ZYA5_9LECA